LMNHGSTKLPRVKVYTTGKNEWQKLADWPPPDAENERWYFHSGGQAHRPGDGEFNRTKPGRESNDRFTHNPDKPVPTKGGALYPPSDAGPADISGQGKRDDVLVYTSSTFKRDLEVTGPITATVYVTADTPDADVVVWLLDVYPDGKARIITDGIARARYRKGGDNAWLSDTSPTAVDVDLWAASHVIKEGHKLRVHVAASNYPRFAPNPCTKADPGSTTRFERSRVRVYHDQQHPSHVVLSVR